MLNLGRWIKYALAGMVVLLLLWQGWFLAHIVWWKWNAPAETSFMRIRLAEKRLTQADAALNYQWVEYGQISSHLKRAVVAAEDDGFVDHEGFDWDGIEKALEKNQKKGKVVAGGSTITQQLAKNLFLTPNKSYFRKVEEAVITLMLENLWSKRRIFEVYLNTIVWGNGVFGAEAAARHYFNTSAAQLGPEQAARLAGMVPNPRYYDRNRNAPGLAKKTAIILGRMPAAEIP